MKFSSLSCTIFHTFILGVGEREAMCFSAYNVGHSTGDEVFRGIQVGLLEETLVCLFANPPTGIGRQQAGTLRYILT